MCQKSCFSAGTGQRLNPLVCCWPEPEQTCKPEFIMRPFSRNATYPSAEFIWRCLNSCQRLTSSCSSSLLISSLAWLSCSSSSCRHTDTRWHPLTQTSLRARAPFPPTPRGDLPEFVDLTLPRVCRTPRPLCLHSSQLHPAFRRASASPPGASSRTNQPECHAHPIRLCAAPSLEVFWSQLIYESNRDITSHVSHAKNTLFF